MIRILFIVVFPFFLPTAVYILWRTFAPVRIGGSEAIAKDQWEPLPWNPLLIAGGVCVAIALVLAIVFPGVFGGAELVGRPRSVQ